MRRKYGTRKTRLRFVYKCLYPQNQIRESKIHFTPSLSNEKLAESFASSRKINDENKIEENKSLAWEIGKRCTFRHSKRFLKKKTEIETTEFRKLVY